MAKAKATDPMMSELGASFVAIEPLRIDGVDIAPGDPFAATAEIAKPLIASGAARAAK